MIVTLPYPRRKAEILRFIRRHHYTRRCPGVWQVAYGWLGSHGKIQAVLMYGPPPYPSIARAFCRRPEDAPRVAWQTRMVGQGLSAAELDALIAYANADLTRRGFWWVLTLTDSRARLVEGGLLRYLSPGFTGEVYHRNGWLFLGQAGRPGNEGWLIDGKLVHRRQGRVTLTRRNVARYYPAARTVREVRAAERQRWAYVLGNARERAERVLLMQYQPRPWDVLRQPRLLARLTGVLNGRFAGSHL